jgi:hypothetical protein
MNMRESVSIVPVESVFLVAEIKTTLRTSDLNQVTEQNQRLGALGITQSPLEEQPPQPDTRPKFIIPTVILAYDTEAPDGTVVEWMNKNGNTVAACVINKVSVLRVEKQGCTICKTEQGKPKYWETLLFVGALYNLLERQMQSRRNIYFNWGQYILGDNN